jgi:hypothetical protein
MEVVLTELRVLFCADPLTPRRVDEHFAGQAAIVGDLGGQVALAATACGGLSRSATGRSATFPPVPIRHRFLST